MNKRPTKAEIRRQLEQQIADYVGDGGEIHRIRPGVSGLADGEVLRPSFNDGQPSQPRTPALDVLAAIDARRKEGKTAKPAARSRKPRKKMIYDDFGEPIREVWVED